MTSQTKNLDEIVLYPGNFNDWKSTGVLLSARNKEEYHVLPIMVSKYIVVKKSNFEKEEKEVEEVIRKELTKSTGLAGLLNYRCEVATRGSMPTICDMIWGPSIKKGKDFPGQKIINYKVSGTPIFIKRKQEQTRNGIFTRIVNYLVEKIGFKNSRQEESK